MKTAFKNIAAAFEILGQFLSDVLTRRLFLSLWLRHKVKEGRKQLWIRPVWEELDFMHDKKASDIHALRYIPDRLNGTRFPWDYQGDAVRTFANGGGDCNWLNRCWQVFAALNWDCDAYLVTWFHKPVKPSHLWKYYNPKTRLGKLGYMILNVLGIALAHTTVVVREYNDKGHIFWGFDYGERTPGRSLKECLDIIAEKKYGVKISTYVAQDEWWKEQEIE